MDNKLIWIGVLLPSCIKVYKVAIEYPSDYPYKSQEAFVIEPKLKNSIHMYSSGSLCLMYPQDNTYTCKTTAEQIV